MKKIQLIILILIICEVSMAQTINLSVSGNVSFDNAAYSIGEAGEDFPSEVTAQSSAYLSVEYVNFMDIIFGTDVKWRVFVNKSDISWHQNLNLEIRRTGNGNKASWFGPSPTLNHGASFQTITNNPVYFFRGRYGTLDIPLGFRLAGASLSMGASQFETTITFTIYDDW